MTHILQRMYHLVLLSRGSNESNMEKNLPAAVLIPCLQKHVIQKPSNENPSNRLLHEMTTIPFQKKKKRTPNSTTNAPRLKKLFRFHHDLTVSWLTIPIFCRHQVRFKSHKRFPPISMHPTWRHDMTSVIESWLDNRPSLLTAYERP